MIRQAEQKSSSTDQLAADVFAEPRNDTPTRKELIASSHSKDEIRQYITADSLEYLSLKGMLEAASGNMDKHCTACFTEAYPIPFTKEEIPGSDFLEIFNLVLPVYLKSQVSNETPAQM